MITTTHPIIEEVKKQGFSVIESDELKFAKGMESHKSKLMESWESLELDQHMKDGGTYRLRRYGRFTFNPKEGSLEIQKNITYFQSKDYNPLNGGEVRKFAPLTEETINNPFLRALILFNFSQLPIPEELYNGLWNVGIHQIRIIAEPGKPGNPTPEGIHKDGEMFTVQHMIQRKNIEGGVNSAYDNSKNPIGSWTQKVPFDSFYFEDDAIYHGVTPIESKDKNNPGVRDILLIDFDPKNE